MSTPGSGLDMDALNIATEDAKSEAGSGAGEQIGGQMGREAGDAGARAAADVVAPGAGSAPVVGDTIGKVGGDLGADFGSQIGSNFDQQSSGQYNVDKPSAGAQSAQAGMDSSNVTNEMMKLFEETVEAMGKVFEVATNALDKGVKAGMEPEAGQEQEATSKKGMGMRR